jgi:3-deoxy-D-manno-octulosonic-acid transferase
MASASLWLYRALMFGALPVAVPLIWFRDRLTGKQRPRFRDRLARDLPPLDPGGIWIQAVSVGEVEVARRLLRELEERRPELPALLTATTATGLALARRTVADRVPVVPCPLDRPAPVARIFEAARPRLLVLVETELWPEMLHQAGRRVIPAMVVNGRLSEGSFKRYRRVRGLLRRVLEPLTRVLVRDSADERRFAALGVAAEKIGVVGNVKYDLEPDHSSLDWEDALRRLAANRPVLVAGSTMDGEEVLVLDALDRLGGDGPRPLLVLAPRHPERFDVVAQLLRQRGVATARRSDIDTAPDAVEVLLLDTIGELGRAYRLGKAAFIGGSLVATGGHNPLESAVWGVPVLTGPHVFNFREVYDEMVVAGGARIVRDAGELAGALGEWICDPEAASRVGAAGRKVVEANRGAVSRTVDVMLELIEGEKLHEDR